MTALGELIKLLARGERKISIAGLAGSSKAYLISRLLKEERTNVFVYLAPSIKEAARVQSDLQFFGVAADLFPPHDALPFAGLSPHLDLSCQRMKILEKVVSEQSRLIITTPTALLPRLPPPHVLNPILLRQVDEFDREKWISRLESWGYQRVTLVNDRGTYAVRGGIIDLFPPTTEAPVRIELEGDLIESIRLFDPRSQKSLRELAEAKLIPAREVILTEETTRRFEQNLRRRAEEGDIPKSNWGPLLEKVRAGQFFSGIETFLPFFYDTPATLRDYLKEPQRGQPLFILDHPQELKNASSDFYQEIQTILEGAPSGGKKSLITLGETLIGHEALFSSLEGQRRIELSPFQGPGTIAFQTETHETIRGEIRRNESEPLAPLAKRISSWSETDRLIIVAPSETQGGRVKDLLARYFTSPLPFEIAVGTLSSGFRYPEERINYLTDEEIFGPRIVRPTQKSFGKTALSSLSEIEPGDPLVHKDHGIGLFRGLVHLKIEEIANDYLLMEYRGGDKLYLPVYRMNLVQRYAGSDGTRLDGTPRIDKLGGTSWITLRKKAEKAIREMAGDLLNLYAARSAGKGFAFSPPDEMFEAFEARFPFEETPDQASAIAETLKEMQGDRPMDRLILGDVGYGKTEVAMRAIFKAVLDGKQAAVLVPTTLLAFQHFERFKERFLEMPVKIEMLSRFRSRTEQKQIVKEISQGKIDIVIGTHRLLQPDLSFKNLGLLVVDEEHRFGVSHKERIKHLRKNVDVLSLSATPIPRTLYMSLVGIRGVSVIETPPSERLAVRTYLLPFQDSVIREAIHREIKRGGQVFYLYNKVETIGRMKEHLEKLVPEAKCQIAHGQMDEEELEEVMIRFYHQEFNLLLCTTIIESGIDVPTANTILIHDAPNFGLAQIYQLRGRVGRGAHRAFCYLLIPPDKELTPEATKRLDALQRFSELGSGAQLASYDLEIRGAGNLLGREQSGQMAAIGFELYTEFLQKAVADLQRQRRVEGEAPTAWPAEGATQAPEIDPELHFKMPSFIPETYIPDPPLRLEFYRRLSSLNSEDEIDPILDEMRDRFGKPPEEVEKLLELSAIKTYAKKLRLKQIRYDGRNFSYAFDPTSPLPPEILTERIRKNPKQCRLTPDMRFIIHQPLPENLVFAATKKFLREISMHLGA